MASSLSRRLKAIEVELAEAQEKHVLVLRDLLEPVSKERLDDAIRERVSLSVGGGHIIIDEQELHGY